MTDAHNAHGNTWLPRFCLERRNAQSKSKMGNSKEISGGKPARRRPIAGGKENRGTPSSPAPPKPCAVRGGFSRCDAAARAFLRMTVFVALCGVDFPRFAPVALQVWGCTSLAKAARKKLCAAHLDHFRKSGSTGRKLCLMKVARGTRAFHGVDSKLLDDSSRELQSVAGMPCLGCTTLRPASGFRLLAPDASGRYPQDAGRFLFQRTCRACQKKKGPLPDEPTPAVRGALAACSPRRCPLQPRALDSCALTVSHPSCCAVIRRKSSSSRKHKLL